MRNARAFRLFCAVGVVMCGSLHASDRELVGRYYTLVHPADRLVLKANETAIIDGTVGFDWGYNWMNVLYKQGTNDAINLHLPLRLGLETTSDIMPLAGPAVITLNTNLPEDGPLYTGAAGFKVVRTIHTRKNPTPGLLNPPQSEQYFTLAQPAQKLALRANETAIITGTTNICGVCNWMNILYKKEGNDFLNVALPLGLVDGTMALSGPGLVMLNTNDANFFGAEYTGALQLKLVRSNNKTSSARYHVNAHDRPSGPFYTLAYPGDRLLLKANETAIIEGTVGYDWAYNWVNILYKRGTNDFTNMILPLGLTGGTVPLSGPCVIVLNTNDAHFYGALYTGAVGVRVVRTIDRNASN